MKTGVDAHKRRCIALTFEGDSVTGSFDFPTTRQDVSGCCRMITLVDMINFVIQLLDTDIK